jgi:hypothetical protein
MSYMLTLRELTYYSMENKILNSLTLVLHATLKNYLYFLLHNLIYAVPLKEVFIGWHQK